METANIDNLLGPYVIGPLCPRLIDGLCLRIARAHEKAMMFVNMPATYLRLVPGHLPTVPVLLVVVQSCMNQSKLLVSLLVTPRRVPYIKAYMTPLKSLGEYCSHGHRVSQAKVAHSPQAYQRDFMPRVKPMMLSAKRSVWRA